MIILRSRHLTRLHTLLAESAVVAVIGARQIGTTTLARPLAQQTTAAVTVFDVENPRDLARLEDPLLALEDREGTVHRYLGTLSAALVLRQLPPWFENLGKRQMQAPQIYVTDRGLLHTLLGVETGEALERHPKVGAAWEGVAMGEVITRLGARPEQCFFWATHTGAELDVLVVRGPRRWGFELKRTVVPRLTRSMQSALADVHLERLDVVQAGEHTFPLAANARALALKRL